MHIKIRGISYYFEVHQNVEPLPYLILLHGFMGSSNVFDHLIPELREFCNPVTIDLLGHGRSEGTELHYRFSTREQVADISKLIKEQFRTPLFLHGYSMGGRLALQVALSNPSLFRGLILESTSFGIERDSERQSRQALDAARADSIAGNFEQFLDEWNEMPLFRMLQNEKLEQRIRKIQEQQNPLWMSNSLLGFGSGTMPCVKNALSELLLPVQLICGELDSKFIHINQSMRNEIQHAELSIISEAGHRVHLEKPSDFISTVHTFLNHQKSL